MDSSSGGCPTETKAWGLGFRAWGLFLCLGLGFQGVPYAFTVCWR